jgi:hypothetical protein
MNSAYGMPIAVHDANHASSLHFTMLQSTPRARRAPARPTRPLTEQEETINDIKEFWTNLFSISPPSPEQEQTNEDIRMFWKNLFSVPPPASPEKDSAERDFRAFWNKVFCAYRHVIPERSSGEKSTFESFKEFFTKQHNFGRSPFAGMPTSWM